MKRVYNISELHGDKWILRYKANTGLAEAEERFDWLTTMDYWVGKSDGYRLVEIVYDEVVIEEKLK